jgi:hypothetical protein
MTSADPFFFLNNHLPDGDVPFYEYHNTKPDYTLDYHQGYKDGVFTGSSLLTPEHKEWVEKAAALAAEYNPQRKLFFVEWDHPGDREGTPIPGVFIMLDPPRFDPRRGMQQNYTVPKPGTGWEEFLTRLAAGAGFELTEEDIPKFPEVGIPVDRYLIGLFPDRIKDRVWFRFVFNVSVKEAETICKYYEFDTRWFEKIDVHANAVANLISFDLYSDGFKNPCAEIIMKKGVPPTMSEFDPIEEHLKEKILEAHGSVLKDLRVSHFKVPLTEGGWDSGLVKMYIIGSTIEGYKAIPTEG